MWRRAAAKLLSLRSVARPNQMGTSSLWSAIFRPSGTVTKKDEDVIPIATGHQRVEPKFEISGGDLVDYDFKNGPFGTKENPAVMRSYYSVQVSGCDGQDVAPHKPEEFWLIDGKVHVCPGCGQHFLLKCIGIGGIAYYNPHHDSFPDIPLDLFLVTLTEGRKLKDVTVNRPDAVLGPGAGHSTLLSQK